MRRLLLAFAALALASPLHAAVAQAPAPPAQRDWTRSVVATPEGGFRMGNPAARVKVVEYLSLTCPHCATFSREGTPRLIGHYVRSGRVSLEYRNFVLNPADLAAALVARCATPANFFRMADRLFATQEQWSAAALQGFGESGSPTSSESLVRAADSGGLVAMASQFGVGAARARQCAGDRAGVDRLLEIYRAAEELGINGTPTFLINGARVEANRWPEIETLIRRAGG